MQSSEIFNRYYRKELDAIKLLIEADPKIMTLTDKYKRTLLMNAIVDNEIPFVNVLMQYSADVNAHDKNGYTALHFVVDGNNKELVELLLKSNADIEAKDNYGNTPLFRAVMSSKGNGDIILLLLGKGADRDNKNDYGVSPIGLANTISNYDIKQFFV